MKNFYRLTFLFLSLMFFCSSCATIFNGTKQRVTIHSQPQGATVKIHDRVVGTTPLTVRESPKRPLNITFSYPGYEERTLVLKNKYQWKWFLLDAPLTYSYICIPFAVDVLTQAPFRFVQKEVTMKFDSVYATVQVLDSAQMATKVLIDREIEETRMEMAELKRKDREIFIQQERERRLKLREQRIRMEWVRDSTLRAQKKRKYDALRARNYTHLTAYKNSLLVELSSIAIGESRLEYHRNVYKGMSIGLEVGYKPGGYYKKTYNEVRIYDTDGPTKRMMAMPFTESYYLGLAAKIPMFEAGSGKYYISVVGFVRNSFYHHQEVSWNEGNGYSGVYYVDSLSVDQNTYGLKFLIGMRKIVPLNKLALEFDVYSGFSCRNVTSELFHYEKVRKQYYSTSKTVTTNEAEKITEFIPTLQMGVKVGLRF